MRSGYQPRAIFWEPCPDPRLGHSSPALSRRQLPGDASSVRRVRGVSRQLHGTPRVLADGAQGPCFNLPLLMAGTRWERSQEWRVFVLLVLPCPWSLARGYGWVGPWCPQLCAALAHCLISSPRFPCRSRIWGSSRLLNLKVTGLSLIALAVASPASPTLGCTSLFLFAFGLKCLKWLGRRASKLWVFGQCPRMSSGQGDISSQPVKLAAW